MQKPINLFWSGGWDSTFRLLQLLLVKKLQVQPFYIIDPGRKSIINELNAIQKICSEINRLYPENRELLLPVKYFALFNIKANKRISESHSAIQKKQRMGIQYEWLARFCNQQNITDMEISLELRTKNEDNIVINACGNFLTEEQRSYGKVFKVSHEAKGTNIHNLFGKMIFPVIDLTKKQMHETAQKNGFSELMNYTWFCHTPANKNHACGKCQPCRSVVSEGLSWRLPASAKFRHAVWPVLRMIALRNEKAF